MIRIWGSMILEYFKRFVAISFNMALLILSVLSKPVRHVFRLLSLRSRSLAAVLWDPVGGCLWICFAGAGIHTSEHDVGAADVLGDSDGC